MSKRQDSPFASKADELEYALRQEIRDLRDAIHLMARVWMKNERPPDHVRGHGEQAIVDCYIAQARMTNNNSRPHG